MLIDRYLPTLDVTEVHEIFVDAPLPETYVAIRAANLRDPLIDALFVLRELPTRLARRVRRERPETPPARITFNDATEEGSGWVLLGEDPGRELVLGSVGRFWERDYGGRVLTAAQFKDFNEPGYAKLALSRGALVAHRGDDPAIRGPYHDDRRARPARVSSVLAPHPSGRDFHHASDPATHRARGGTTGRPRKGEGWRGRAAREPQGVSPGSGAPTEAGLGQVVRPWLGGAPSPDSGADRGVRPGTSSPDSRRA